MKVLVNILNFNLPEYTDVVYECLEPYKNDLYDTTKTDFLYKAKSTVVSNSDNKRQHVYQKYSKS